MDVATFANALNLRAPKYQIGGLQALRTELKQHKHQRPAALFGGQSIKDDYAFHLGGRKELQFNVGNESVDGVETMRHGVAFSFETSQSLPDIDVLLPKVARFNEFLRVYPDEYADLRMWHYDHGHRSPNYSPSPIPPERCRNKTFVFLGRSVAIEEVDVEQTLTDFDRLLPLYRFVEETVSSFPTLVPDSDVPAFTPGCRVKKSSTTLSSAERLVDVSLRHNDMQALLHKLLVEKHGLNAVGTEQPLSSGGRADVVVVDGLGRIYYEIKTDLSARACVRAAIAQLLEYSYWPGGAEAKELVIVGEAPLDPATRLYLSRLSDEFHLPLVYRQLDLVSKLMVG